VGKIPELVRGIGNVISEFKKGVKEEQEEQPSLALLFSLLSEVQR